LPSAVAQPAERAQRVLIIYEPDSQQAAAIEVSGGLRRGLMGNSPTDIELYSEYLDSVRFPGPDHLDRMAGQLAEKYGSMELDAAVALGPAALDFLVENGRDIAPGIPIFFGAVPQTPADRAILSSDAIGVVSNFDVRSTLALARSLQPGAREAVVIFGSADFDKTWEATAREELGDRHSGFDIRYLSNLTLDGFERAVSRLPADTVVLMLTVYEDGAGKRFVPRDAAREIAAASRVPVYAVYDTFVDGGVVGGYMGTFSDTGEQVAALVQSYLRGDRELPNVTPQVTQAVVDWREIQRFGMEAAALPAGTQIRFRAPSLLDDYRETVLVTIAVLLLQAGTIAALIVQGNRRRKAEAEVATGRLELAHLSRASLLGELSGSFAHELNQPLTSILANAQVGKQMLDSGVVSREELGEILSDIVADDKRAAEVIVELRRLLTKGDASVERLDLNLIVSATLKLARSEILARQTRVEFSPTAAVHVVGNASQLQQVVLNLVMNAVDATSHLPPGSRQIDIGVRKCGRWGDVVVSDNGRGVNKDMMADAFKPFVSTKPNGLGLGLSICSSIARAHGGSLRFDQGGGVGAQIVLSLPLEEQEP
jgi:signal transduction histidine kinase